MSNNKFMQNYDNAYGKYKKNRKLIDINIIESFEISSNSNVAIIIPHRNRLDHLQQFIDHFNKLDMHNNNLDVYVIDQNNADPFNRGILLNIGFELARNTKKYDRYIFHDVDSYPEQKLFDLYFSHFDKIIHFASPLLEYKYTNYSFFGGIVGFNENDFKKINGFSNTFFGHGGEDDSMLNRIIASGLTNVFRPKEGKYKLIDHDRPTNLEKNIVKKKNILDDLKKWRDDGIKQLSNVFINLKKYESHQEFINTYELENSNIVNDAINYNSHIDNLSNNTAMMDSTTTNDASENNRITYIYYKIDYLAKHKKGYDILMDKDFINRQTKEKINKLKEGEFKNKDMFYNSKDNSFVSSIYPITTWEEIEEKIISTYTDPITFNAETSTKVNNETKNPELKNILDGEFAKYNNNLTKENLFDTIKFIFDNYNELLYFRIRKNKLECSYHLYNPKNKKDWYKDLTYYTKNVDDAFLEIARNSNEYYTLRKPHYMASNNCLLGGIDEYAYWEGNPVSYVYNFKEMIEYVLATFGNVPDCDMLINRKDFAYLRNDGKFAYDHLTDDSIGEDISFYPIGSQAVTSDHMDIPIISSDEWDFSKSDKNIYSGTTWKNKKNTALFRGSGTGCAVDLKNPRLHLAQISHDWNYGNNNNNKGLIDVSLSKLVKRIKSYKKLIGVTSYGKYRHLVGKFMNTEEQLTYKYIFNVEGNSQAYRYSSQFYKGMVINVKSKYYMWFNSLLIPDKHIVEVDNDYNNLKDTIIYLRSNDEKAEEIYNNGLEFANKYTNKDTLAQYMFYYMCNLNNIIS